MTREEIESKWENLKCPVCSGAMREESKQYALLNQEFFSNDRPDRYVFETRPYVCEDCGCTIFRKAK
ncbi:hypothetical protein [Clostridium sp. HBUAS56010]|uniref:hypothetical protein n=1 Tax=Clostridium sp. HBUAS56010 TaxID=2571127 RepID=UPI00117857D0|nr:hypothetical protein [Clostridium sp. HBUAS56010]